VILVDVERFTFPTVLQLHYLYDQPIKDRAYYPANDTHLQHEHRQTLTSSSKKPNINFLLGNYITYVFSMNRQFSKATVNKYFKVTPTNTSGSNCKRSRVIALK
jgi:hypothetical protein